MIENYLDFAKRQRKRALQRARKAMQDERSDCSEICQGIDAGLRIAFDCQSRHWRTLQKDIEAVVEACEDSFPADEAAYIAKRFY
jgi:hypothetical protein